MSTPFEIMLQGNLTDADRQKMLAQGLRNRRQTGELAILSGDKVLAPLGEGLYNEAIDKEAGALSIKAGEVLSAEDARRWGLDETMGRRKQTEVERHNRAMEELGGLQLYRAQRMDEKDFDTNVRRLSEKMTQYGIPELRNDVDRVGGLIDKYKGDLPGVGATAWVPDALLSKEGVEFRQAIATVRNKLLKIRSGAAVTDPEMARLAEELGQRLGGTDREIALAWPSITEGISMLENGILSGYDDDVVQTFQERLKSRAPSSPRTPAAPRASGGEENVVDWSSL